MDRQQFLKQGFSHLAQSWFSQLESTVAPLNRRELLRPPGAQPESLFLALCTRCDACTGACPHETISVYYGNGSVMDGTPVLANMDQYPCLLCEDTPCIASCPTEALQPVARVQDIRVGTAVIDRLECSAYRGSGCQTCYDVCPVQDQAISLVEGLPIVNESDCTGCGICQHHCPQTPAAIVVYPELALVSE